MNKTGDASTSKRLQGDASSNVDTALAAEASVAASVAPLVGVATRRSQPGSDGFDLEKEERDRDGHTDDQWYQTYSEELLTRFLKADECKGLGGELEWSATFMEIARDEFDINLAHLSDENVAWCIFDEIASTVDCVPEEAEAIVQELRQFWRFLAREYQVQNVDAIVHVLREEAAGILAECIAHATANEARAASASNNAAASKKKAAEVAKRRAKNKAKKKARPKPKK